MNTEKSYIILSIKPEFTYLILMGKKTVEFRKYFAVNLRNSKIFLYATYPLQSILGTVDISEINYADINVLKEKFLAYACITPQRFDFYFKNRKSGFAIKLINPVKFAHAIPLKILRNFNFEPPNSYMTISNHKELIFSFLQKSLQER